MVTRAPELPLLGLPIDVVDMEPVQGEEEGEQEIVLGQVRCGEVEERENSVEQLLASLAGMWAGEGAGKTAGDLKEEGEGLYQGHICLMEERQLTPVSVHVQCHVCLLV